MLALLVLAASAFAGPDFSGTWTLDNGASQSVDALLVASGASWAERAGAATLSVTQTITQSPTEVVLDIDATLLDRREVLRLDGKPHEVATQAGKGTTVTAWQGDALVTVSDLPTPDGRRVELVVRRTLEDGGATMRQRLTLRTAEATLSADRVYRRR